MQSKIKQEQTRMLYAHRANVLGGSFAIGVITTIVLWQSADKFRLGLWFLASFIVVVSRWRLSSNYLKKTREEQDEHYNYWVTQFSAGSLVVGILWGSVPLLFFNGSEEIVLLILVMHAGYVAGSAVTTSIYLPTFLAFVIPSSTLITIGTLASEGWAYWPYALLVVAYTCTMIFYARRSNLFVLEQVTLRFKNAELMADLRKQRDKAEQAMMEKNRFLAAASHDLRQPVHALGLFVSSLESRDDPDQRRYILDRIKQATGALGSLFHGLLDISKLDANVLTNNPRHISVDRLLLLIKEQFQLTAIEKGLEFRVPEQTGFAAYVDDDLLERILRNLISNAIKFTHQGYVTISVEAESDSQLLISVTDSGSGIDAEDHENIFSEYHQLTNPDRDRQKGLGLGLAIVRRLSELTRIPIAVESEQGEGATFKLRVPRGDSLLIAPARVPLKSGENFPLNVVVIDDEQDIIDGMDRLLSTWQCCTTTATSIEEALQKLENKETPDLIMADFRLKGSESGLDAIRVIREEFNEDILAMLVTGDTAPERVQEAASADVKVLYKPVEPALLKQALDLVAEQIRQRQAAEAS